MQHTQKNPIPPRVHETPGPAETLYKSTWLIAAVLGMLLAAPVWAGGESGGGAGNGGGGESGGPIVVASKQFTEGVILGDIADYALEHAGYRVQHRRRLGGTTFCFNALVGGEIDVYADYTGSLQRGVLSSLKLKNNDQLRAALRRRGLRMTRSLGFQDTYALAVRESMAKRLDLSTISDLRGHRGLRLGFSPEFVKRADSWPGLKPAYHLPQSNPRTIEHELAYAALAHKSVDVIDVYTTDAKLARYPVKVLRDDKGFFPRYDAVYLYRASIPKRAAGALRTVEGRIGVKDMIAMNHAVDGGQDAGKVAAKWARQHLSIDARATASTLAHRLTRTTIAHLWLVLCSMAAGIVVALPLGYLAYAMPRAGQGVLAVTGIFQTIPALALLMFMLPLLGIGFVPAIAALFLYSLLPMVRSTALGFSAIGPDLQESAQALGLSGWARLWRIEAPLALPAALSGIKTSAVMIIGFATLGAFIGAGGYGDPILHGLTLGNMSLVFEGAVPAAIMALVAHGLFEALERLVVPRGLRLKQSK